MLEQEPSAEVHLHLAHRDSMVQHLAALLPVTGGDPYWVHLLKIAEDRAGRTQGEEFCTLFLQEPLRLHPRLILQQIIRSTREGIDVLVVEAPASSKSSLVS